MCDSKYVNSASSWETEIKEVETVNALGSQNNVLFYGNEVFHLGFADYYFMGKILQYLTTVYKNL